MVGAVATAGALVVGSGSVAHAGAVRCDYRDGLVSSIVVDRSVRGFTIHLAPTDQARTRGPVEFATGSDVVVDDLWQAVRSCVDDVNGTAAESLHQQLECHVWLGVAANATGPTYDLESWRRPLAHPGLASYLRTRCLNDGGSRPDHWQVLWAGVGLSLARWGATAGF